MLGYHAHADPPTLADRLCSLNDNLKALAIRLKDAIASAVSSAIGSVIRDVIRRCLGDQDGRSQDADPCGRRFEPQRDDVYGAGYDRGYHRTAWDDDTSEDDPWQQDSRETIRSSSAEPASVLSNRWGNALRASLQTALCWLRTQPCQRPMLTTAMVALTAGGAAFFAGPTLAASVSVIASVASLLLTADSARTAAEAVTSVFR